MTEQVDRPSSPLQWTASIAGLIALVGLLVGLVIACATIKRGVHDEAQCIAPTLDAVAACASFNPLTACPALVAWYDCLEKADAHNQTVKVVLPPVTDGGAK